MRVVSGPKVQDHALVHGHHQVGLVVVVLLDVLDFVPGQLEGPLRYGFVVVKKVVFPEAEVVITLAHDDVFLVIQNGVLGQNAFIDQTLVVEDGLV